MSVAQKNGKMRMDMLDLTTIKKDLYKTKVMANFSHYCGGNLYYTVEIGGNKYQFPLGTVEGESDGPLKLSTDLGTTVFGSEIKASELIRWIGKSLENGELIKVG